MGLKVMLVTMDSFTEIGNPFVHEGRGVLWYQSPVAPTLECSTRYLACLRPERLIEYTSGGITSSVSTTSITPTLLYLDYYYSTIHYDVHLPCKRVTLQIDPNLRAPLPKTACRSEKPLRIWGLRRRDKGPK